MNVSLTPRLEAMIREKVASGRYNNSSEVVREALRLLEEQEKLHRLRAAIAIGQEQIRRGEGMLFTPELMAEIDREVDERVRRGDTPSADVCP
ncbi:MAG: type II toxin-antitoxin system ParD family antitoxin [Chloroflexota bacterium]|nr:type II toxin-antitoxin system ParD family antitoxin [Chloroflexota bacterium]